MNKKQIVSEITNRLRENSIRKDVCVPKYVFHLSDDNGNHKDFVVKVKDKTVAYTAKDVEAILEVFTCIVEDSLKRGESVTWQGFGTFGVHFRAARKVRNPNTGEWTDVAERHVPKFHFGKRLRLAARVYHWSLQDTPFETPDTFDDEEWDDID